VPGFLGFALTDKVNELWSSESFTVAWPLRDSPKLRRLGPTGVRRLLSITESYYLLILVLALAGAIRRLVVLSRGQGPSGMELVLYTTSAGLLLAHVFVEVQGRYHLIFYPLLAIGAGYTLAELAAARPAVSRIAISQSGRTRSTVNASRTRS